MQHEPCWNSWGSLFCWVFLGSGQSFLTLFHLSCCTAPRKTVSGSRVHQWTFVALTNLTWGPPPLPSAQGLHCSSVPSRIPLWMCLSLAPAVLQSCLAMRPVDLAGSWPVDSAPSLTLDLPCQYGLSWVIMRMGMTLATTVRLGLTLTWWFACQAWLWTYLVTTNCSGLQEASCLRGARL